MLLRKSLRKTIALLITFAMVFTSFPPVSVFAEYYDGYAYVNEGTEIDYPSYDEPEYNEIDNDNAEVDSTPEDDNDLEVGNDSVNDNDLEVDNDSMNDNDLEVGNDSVNDNDLEIDNNSVNDNDLEVGNDSVNDNDLEVDNDSMNDNDLEVDNDSVNDNDLEVDNDSVNDNDLEVGNDSVNDNDLEVDNDSVNDNDFGFATELTIEVAETYVAGEAFELIVRANAAGFLNVYLNDENIYGNFINAFQPIIVQVEEMPPVEAVFDIVLQLDPYGFVYVRETLVLAAYVEYIAIEAELAIEAAESYVAGESFEFEVVPNTAGVLRVYLDNENLFSSAVFADQSVIVQVEEMPPVMASFDVVLVMDSYGLDYVEEDFVVVADIMPFAGWADIDWDLTAPIGGVGDFDFLGTGAGNFTTADLNETGDLTWELNGTWRNGSGTGAINDIQPGGAGRTITATGVPAGPIAVRVWASHAGNNGAIIAIPPTFGVAGNNMTIGGQSADYIVNEVNDVSRPNAGSYVWFYWLDSPGGTLTFNITWPAVEIVPGRVRIAAIDVFEGDGDGSNNGGGTPPTIAVPTQTTGRTGTRINYGTNASVVGQANNPARAAVLFGNSEALLDGGYYRNVEFIAYKYTQFTGTQNQIFQSFAIELSSGADDNRDVVAVRTRTENLAVGTGNYRNYSHLQFGIVNRVQATSNTGGDLPAPNFPTTPPNPFHNPSYSVATANQYRMVVDIDEDTWELTAVISINGNVVSTLQEDVPMGAYVTTIYARSRIGATMHIPAWALYGTSSDFIEAPLVGIEGIVGNTHNFGSVAHNYTASDFSALEITVDNTGTAPAENLEITLTGDVDSFDLSGTLSVASLAVGQEIEFEVVPLEGLASGSHSGVVTIDADGITPISFNVIFDVAFQEANVDWATDATYAFDFGNFPTYMLNHTDNAPDNDQRPLFPVLRGAAISTMSNSTRYISSSASQQNFNLIVGAPGANNFFRPGGNPGSTFIEPNGGGRYLESNVPLTGPIRVELDVVSLITNGSFTLTASFGDQTVSQTVSGTGVQTVVIEFATLEEGILTIGPLPWGVNTPPEVAVNPPGRFGIQAINIYEGEFSGPWLEIPVGLEVNFPSLPHDYTVADLVTELVTITNIGVGTVDMIANVGSNFEIFQAPSTGLGTGAITEVGIRPAIGLAPGLYQDTLVITTDNANTLNIPVSVRVYNPPLLPDTNLFYTGLGTSLPNQFPHNLTEIVNWGHDFRRVVFTEGSHLIRFNGQLRDADVSLAIPFLLNGVLWVPVEAASLALPGTVWTLDENDLTVTFGTASYEGIALVATQAVDGGDAAFVPLQIIANVLGVGNIGWDIRSNTLVVVTGIAVEQGNVLYNAINNRHEAWYGSPNSLVIATNFVYFQRDNGGWPRGNGQINAMPFQPDVGGMSPEAVQIIANNHAAEDSYFGRGITTNETRFLLRMYEATGIERFRDAGLRGLDTIFNVQNAGGGWPYQITGGSYHRGVSISDNAIENIMTLLMNIYKDDLFVDTIGQARVARNANAFNSGMNWILGSQVRSSGFADGQERLTGWPFHVYQHGINNLPLFPGAIAGAAGRPAWAREFEPPSISGNESIDIVGFLMTIPNPSQEVQDAIHAAVYFFDYIQITGYRLYHNPAGFMHPQLGRHLVPDPTATRSLWARFIDVETLSPLFYDRTVPTSSPHSGVSPTNFQAEHGAWLGTPANHISHNATSATNARGGTRRSLYRDANGVLSTDPSGTFDLAASFHNLSHERRMGFNYINHFAENLPQMYEEWRERIGLDEGPQLPQPTPTPTPDPGTPTPDPGTPTPDPGTPTPDPGTPTPDPGIPTPQPPQILPVPQPPSTTTQPSVVRSWRSDRTSTTRPGAGANRVVQQTQVPELVQDGMLIPISESSPIILDIIENAIQAASIPMVTFVLQDEVGVVFSYEGLQLIIEQNGYLEIMRDYFSITFDSEFLARLGEPGDEITIIVLPQEIIIMINGIVVSFEEGQDTTYQPIIPISEVTMATLRLTVGSTAYYLHGSVRQSEEAPFVDLTTGRTMVPLRIIAEALGMNVTWNEPARTVHIITEQGMLIIPVDVSLPDSMGTPIIVNGRTFVPVRYVMEALGANVEWNEATGAIYIYR